MKIAYTGWTWLVHHEDNQRYEFEQFLKEISSLGYQAAENFAFIKGYFDGDAGEIRRLLDQYGLEMANLYLHLTDDPEQDYRKAVEYTDFMQKIGATYLNLQGVMWRDAPNERPTDPERVRAYAALCNQIGALCAEKGLVACFHPHANTPVFSEAQIDLFLASTDPALCGLCLDTAHTTIAGMDAVAAVRKYADRIRYLHLKDVDPDESVSPAWPMARFLPLGWGTVDFRGVLKALRANGYDGVLCVELDAQPVCNYHSAMVSRAYLRDVLGL